MVNVGIDLIINKFGNRFSLSSNKRLENRRAGSFLGSPPPLFLLVVVVVAIVDVVIIVVVAGACVAASNF